MARRPFAFVETGARGVRLSAVDPVAIAMGLATGDVLADARAIHPSLVTATATPAADRSRLRKLAHWLGRYGIARNAYGFVRPAAGGYPIRHYGLWVDISGVAHLYRGERALLADLEGRLTRFGLTARIGLADTFGAAHALAWSGGFRSGTAIAAPGATLEAIAGLPVEGLRLEVDTVRRLGRLGFKTIGALAAVPRVSIERRFRSREAGRRVLLRLDQALDVVKEPRRPMVDPPALRVEALFAEPLVSAEGLLAETRRLVERLCAELEKLRLCVRALRLVLYRSDGTFAEAAIGTSRACLDPHHLMRLLAEKLDGLDLGFGADMLVLEVVRGEPASHDQRELTVPVEGEMSAGAEALLIDRLANRLGAGNVVHLRPVASHWPERAVVAIPALGGTPPIGQGSGSARDLCAPGWLAPGWLAPGQAPRPALMLDCPEPIEVMAEVPGGAPVRFIWRRVVHKIASAAGPERIEPEWWHEFGAGAATSARSPVPASAHLDRSRDYFRLEDIAGARFWVFRAGRYDDGEDGQTGLRPDAHGDADAPPAWFVHGFFA